MTQRSHAFAGLCDASVYRNITCEETLYMQSRAGGAGVCYAIGQTHCARRLQERIHLSYYANDTVYLSKAAA